MTDLIERPTIPAEEPARFERTPPHDLLAEQSALGGMLLNADARIDVAAILTAGDFYQPRHGIIFNAIVALDATDTPVDAVTVAAHLADAGTLVKVGGAPYLHDLLASVPTAANATYYARIVADRAQLRRLIESATSIVHLGYNPAGQDVPDVVEAAQKLIHDATVGREQATGTSWDELAMGVLEAIEQERAFTGISTGLIEGDALTSGGFKPGELIVIAGRPGMGKSVYVVDIARRAAFRDEKSVAIFSLEMSAAEMALRVTAAESRVELESLKSGEMTEHETKRVTDAFAKIHGSRLVIDDNAVTSLATIRSRARRLQQRQGLDLVIIDYLQLMTPGRRSENRATEVGEISRGLKLLAKELGVPVIVAAQLNRNSEARTDKRPQISDLRESGSIENDADVVILIHRDGYYNKESTRGAEADFDFAKNRHGATDRVVAIAQLHVSRFVDYHPEGGF